LDGGITSGLQEDHLSHATPAAIKLLKIIDNAELIIAIEVLAAAQAYELQRDTFARAPQTDEVYRRIRAAIPQYQDDRPLGIDLQRARELIRGPLRELG
jgi:histidine ammonia-lyase